MNINGTQMHIIHNDWNVQKGGKNCGNNGIFLYIKVCKQAQTVI